jgi:hypothetical protein
MELGIRVLGNQAKKLEKRKAENQAKVLANTMSQPQSKDGQELQRVFARTQALSATMLKD